MCPARAVVLLCPGVICNYASAAVICHHLEMSWDWSFAARAAGMASGNGTRGSDSHLHRRSLIQGCPRLHVPSDCCRLVSNNGAKLPLAVGSACAFTVSQERAREEAAAGPAKPRFEAFADFGGKEGGSPVGGEAPDLAQEPEPSLAPLSAEAARWQAVPDLAPIIASSSGRSQDVRDGPPFIAAGITVHALGLQILSLPSILAPQNGVLLGSLSDVCPQPGGHH